jgi:hypothetical protein
VRSHKPPVCGIREGHVSTASLQLANISSCTGRKIFWDQTRQEIAGDSESSRYLRKEYRRRQWRGCLFEEIQLKAR